MKLRQALNKGETIILDGAMGTELEKRGLQGKLDVNRTNPEAVLEIHREYFRAGSRVMTANTFLLNEIYAARNGLSFDLYTANQMGVKLARIAAGADDIVLGDVGPTGQLLEPHGPVTVDEAAATYEKQARSFVEAGVDGIIIETMTDLREALCALQACRRVSQTLPILVSMQFKTETRGGWTEMGNAAKDCARQLTEEGADAIGTNCGRLLPHQLASIIETMRANTSLPLLVKANAGTPSLKDGRTEYPINPDAFVQGMLVCRQRGASILGGCCGTTPEHIRALASHIQEGR